MYTGIDTRYYSDKKKVLGTARKGEEALPELSFPGFSPKSVEFLTKERNVTERLPNRRNFLLVLATNPSKFSSIKLP